MDSRLYLYSMKLSLIAIAFGCLLAYSCKPSGYYGPKIRGKVVRITCATTVIQVLDSAYYDLGETWPVHGTTDTIQHAAQVLNKCEFPADLTADKEFYFYEIPQSQARNNCAVCMLYDYPPSKGIYLRVAR